MLTRRSLSLLLALLVSALPFSVSGQEDDLSISELSFVDRQYMASQRGLLEDLASGKYGHGFNGNKANDLSLLQRLLDDRVVKDSQTQELQAMGIIMGDLLADELTMDWVVYKDKVGRSRALRYKNTESYLFPVTMISRRREAGNHDPVEKIYRKAVDDITPLLPERPFQ